MTLGFKQVIRYCANEFVPNQKQELFKLDEDELIIQPEAPKAELLKNNLIEEENLIKDAFDEQPEPVEEITNNEPSQDSLSFSDQAAKIFKLMQKIQSDDAPEEVDQAYVDPQN